ncbi:hypothetical protein [Streptomyces sp. NPDC055749]
MVDEGEPRLFVNRWGDASNTAPGGRDSHREVCTCFDQAKSHPRARVGFHSERQDTSAAGWQRLLELIDEAADDGREEFRPLVALSAQERRQVITLPTSIAKLTAVKRFVLYGRASPWRREIRAMAAQGRQSRPAPVRLGLIDHAEGRPSGRTSDVSS